MSNRQDAAAGSSPNDTPVTTPNRAGVFGPPSNPDSSYRHPGLRNQASNHYSWSSRTAAQPTSTLTSSDLDRPRSMASHFGEDHIGPTGGPLVAIPQPRQPPGYIPLSSDIDMRPHHLGDMRYPTLLPNVSVENSAGTQDIPQRSRQPGTGNQPSQDSVPQIPYLQCGWTGCSKTKPFAREGDLVRHVKYQHISRERFRCGINSCTKDFTRPDNRDAHIKKCHANA